MGDRCKFLVEILELDSLGNLDSNFRNTKLYSLATVLAPLISLTPCFRRNTGGRNSSHDAKSKNGPVTRRQWVDGSKVETIRGSFPFQLGRLEKYCPVRSKVSWMYTRNIVLRKRKRIKYLLGGEKLEHPKKLSGKDN